MMPTYKGKLDYNPRPLIGLVEIDLNGDKMPEIISYPLEEDEETGKFCNLDQLCPHYITQISGKKADVIGVMYGWKVNKGDRVINGYLTLKAYTWANKDPETFIEYSYSPATKEYRPVSK